MAESSFDRNTEEIHRCSVSCNHPATADGKHHESALLYDGRNGKAIQSSVGRWHIPFLTPQEDSHHQDRCLHTSFVDV